MSHNSHSLGSLRYCRIYIINRSSLEATEEAGAEAEEHQGEAEEQEQAVLGF